MAIISVIHATARVEPTPRFPRGFMDAVDAFRSRCQNPALVEYILVVHKSRWAKFCELFPDLGQEPVGDTMPVGYGHNYGFFGFQDFRVVRNEGRDCVVDQINAGAAASTGLLLTGSMDDYAPPLHWDTLLTDALPIKCSRCGAISDGNGSLRPYEWNCAVCTRPMGPKDAARDFEGEYVIHCSTGSPRDSELIIGGCLSRTRYERYGFILDPDFESMFADDWYTFVAKRDAEAGLCKLITRMDIEFVHAHPAFDASLETDHVYEQHNRQQAYKDGSVILNQKITGSPLMICCFAGENFRSEITASRFSLVDGIRSNTQFHICVPIWGHTTNVYMTRMELAETAINFPSCKRDEDLILWIDDDNDLTGPQLRMLLNDLEANPNLAGVMGWCWCDHQEEEDSKAEKWMMSCGRQNPENLDCLRFTMDDFNKAYEKGSCLISPQDLAPHALWSGMPVVLMRRRIMELMGPQAFRARTADPVLVDALKRAESALSSFPFALSGWEVDTLQKVRKALQWADVLDHLKMGQTSEDTSFFFRAHELGLEFAVDIRVRVPHLKVRGIKPQYVPESERKAVERTQGVNV